jgi:hypothetical protein
VKEEKEKKEATWFDLKQNTSVYVTGLPEDVSVEEVHACPALPCPTPPQQSAIASVLNRSAPATVTCSEP